MSELFKIVLTSSLTVCGGIFLLVAGEIITKFFIEPIHEQFRLMGEIADSIIFYANVYSSPRNTDRERLDEASKVFRQQASQLRARTNAIRWYRLWQFLRVVCKRENIVKASAHLIGLSNQIYHDEGAANHELAKEITKLLDIDPLTWP